MKTFLITFAIVLGFSFSAESYKAGDIITINWVCNSLTPMKNIADAASDEDVSKEQRKVNAGMLAMHYVRINKCAQVLNPTGPVHSIVHEFRDYDDDVIQIVALKVRQGGDNTFKLFYSFVIDPAMQGPKI